MLILFQIGKSLDNMIQFIVFSAIDLALEYIDVINSIRNSSPPSSLKYLRPIGTRVETGGVRILFGGKSKTIRSSSAQIHTSVDNTLAHTVLGWALWCWEALYGNVVVAWLKYCYTHGGGGLLISIKDLSGCFDFASLFIRERAVQRQCEVARGQLARGFLCGQSDPSEPLSLEASLLTFVRPEGSIRTPLWTTMSPRRFTTRLSWAKAWSHAHLG